MSQHSLQLFSLLLKRKPAGIDEGVFEEAQNQYDNLKEKNVSDDEIEQAMIDFGKQVWPYWQAEQDMMESYGKEKKKEIFMQELSEELREKWKPFEENGGSMHDTRSIEAFEEAFTPEENIQIQDALLKVDEEAKKYIKSLCESEKKDEYQELVDTYTKEREEIIKLLYTLKQLKETGDKWDEEIDAYVSYVERGFAELEERPTVEKVKGRVEFYEGQIESGKK